jgi:hypothetical protein
MMEQNKIMGQDDTSPSPMWPKEDVSRGTPGQKKKNPEAFMDSKDARTRTPESKGTGKWAVESQRITVNKTPRRRPKFTQK